MTWPTLGNLLWFGAGFLAMFFIAVWVSAPPRVTEKEERDEMFRRGRAFSKAERKQYRKDRDASLDRMLEEE